MWLNRNSCTRACIWKATRHCRLRRQRSSKVSWGCAGSIWMYFASLQCEILATIWQLGKLIWVVCIVTPLSWTCIGRILRDPPPGRTLLEKWFLATLVFYFSRRVWPSELNGRLKKYKSGWSWPSACENQFFQVDYLRGPPEKIWFLQAEPYVVRLQKSFLYQKKSSHPYPLLSTTHFPPPPLSLSFSLTHLAKKSSTGSPPPCLRRRLPPRRWPALSSMMTTATPPPCALPPLGHDDDDLCGVVKLRIHWFSSSSPVADLGFRIWVVRPFFSKHSKFNYANICNASIDNRIDHIIKSVP